MDDRNEHIDPIIWEKIEAYLLGKLTNEEKEQFEIEINENKDLANQVKIVHATLIGIQEYALQEKIKSWDVSTKKGWIFQFNTWKVVSIAASLLMIVTLGIWWYTQPNATDQLYARYYEQDPGLPTMMSHTQNYDLDKIMIDYKSEKYSKALRSWEKMLVDHPDNDTIQYFMGCAHLALGNTGDALVFLSHVVSQGEGVFYRDANWYLGLTLLKLRRDDAAQKYLYESQHPHSEKLMLEIQQLQQN